MHGCHAPTHFSLYAHNALPFQRLTPFLRIARDGVVLCSWKLFSKREHPGPFLQQRTLFCYLCQQRLVEACRICKNKISIWPVHLKHVSMHHFELGMLVILCHFYLGFLSSLGSPPFFFTLFIFYLAFFVFFTENLLLLLEKWIIFLFHQATLVKQILKNFNSTALVKLMHEASCEHSFSSSVS